MPKFTTIFQALATNDTEVVTSQLKSGTHVDTQDTNGWTPLMYALGSNNYELARILVEDYKANVNLVENWGISPLMIAVNNGHVGNVKMLLEHSANVNIQDKKGQTALMLALKSGDYIITSILKNNLARLDLKNEDGLTALHLAKTNLRPI
jgi:ankyrin repeat protein